MKIGLILKSPWTLFLVALVWSSFRLRAGSTLFLLALTPILAVSMVGQIYESLDEYKRTNVKPFWLRLPFASYVEKSPRLSTKMKRIIAIGAVLWAFGLSYLSEQATH